MNRVQVLSLSLLMLPSSVLAQTPSASPEALEIWDSATFQKRFAESYLAETETEPRVTASERQVLQVVLERMAADDLEGAKQRIESERSEASSAVFDFTLGNIHFQRDELALAMVFYRRAVHKFPKFLRAWKNLGLIHVRRAEFEEALPALQRVIELGGSDSVSFGLLGFSYSNIESHLAAETAFRSASLLDPTTLDWKLGLARSLFGQARFADASALCRLLIREDPERVEFWLLQAKASIGLGEPLAAAQSLELVERMGGSTADSLSNLGSIYVNAELFDLGVHNYRQALERFPEVAPDGALRAASVLTAHGALDSAQTLIESIERLRGKSLEGPRRKELLKLRARLAVAQGAGGEEVLVLKEIVELDPLDGDALILLGEHEGRNNDPEQAAFWYERAAAIEGFEARAKLRHAQLLVGQTRYAEALPLLRRVQTLEPRDNVQQYLAQVERIAQRR